MRSLLLLVALSLVGTACGSRELRESRRMEGRFDIGVPGAGWSKVSTGGADHAYRNRDLSAVIYADSNCGVRFEDGDLIDLARHMTRGVRHSEFESTETLQVDGREALLARVAGVLDGVPVELGITVLKKDFCVYDLVLIGPAGPSFEAAWGDYRVAIDGFRTQE